MVRGISQQGLQNREREREGGWGLVKVRWRGTGAGRWKRSMFESAMAVHTREESRTNRRNGEAGKRKRRGEEDGKWREEGRTHWPCDSWGMVKKEEWNRKKKRGKQRKMKRILKEGRRMEEKEGEKRVITSMASAIAAAARRWGMKEEKGKIGKTKETGKWWKKKEKEGRKRYYFKSFYLKSHYSINYWFLLIYVTIQD